MSEALIDFSNALADTVETVSPGIVRVEGRRRLPATGIIWSADGVIVTAHHVVERDDNITIGLDNGDTLAATLIGRDPSTDLVVLRAESGDLPAATWADLDDVRVGHLVLALGRAGSRVQATMGIISAVGRVSHQHPGRPGWHGGHGRQGGHGGPGGPRGGPRRRMQHAPHQLETYLQTDVVMYPGFSGGPLVDVAGQVRGLNTSIVRGISLAIPTPTVRRVAQSLLEHGRVRRGYLGITSQPVALPENFKQELEQETGLLIIAVEPDSPAAHGGLLLGDTVVGLDDQAIAGMDDLLALLSGDRVGSEVPVHVIRGGELKNIAVTIGERP